MSPQFPTPPTAAQRQSINTIARRTRASIAAEGTVAMTAAVPEGDNTANAEDEGMTMTDDLQDLHGPPETGAAVTAGAGQANAATSPPVLPSTKVFDGLKLSQTCLGHGMSSMGIWGTTLLR